MMIFVCGLHSTRIHHPSRGVSCVDGHGKLFNLDGLREMLHFLRFDFDVFFIEMISYINKFFT